LRHSVYEMDAKFRYPLDPQPRIFPFLEDAPWQPGDAETTVIAAKLLRRVWSDAWSPSLPVLIVTGPRHGVLTADDRDTIWRRWGVPVYEFLTDRSDAVVAWECDAHEGLHVREPGPNAEVRECGCGITGPMIVTGVDVEAAAA